MNKNNINDIEKQLTPKCEFHASDNLIAKIMNSAADDASAASAIDRRFNLRAAFASVASVAAAIALLLIVIPGGTPAIAAERFFAHAAEFFNSISGYSVNFEIRTTPNDNFCNSSPVKEFVRHTMYVSPDGRWKLDKGGRVAEFDGNNILVWFPQNKWGWKFDPDYTDTIYPYDNLLDLRGMMHWAEKYAAGLKDTDCRKYEDEKTVKLVIKAPAQGDYTNDYAKHSNIENSDSRHTYVFSKADGRLLSAEIESRFLCFYRTIMKFISIDYNSDFTASTFAVPDGIEWIDQTTEAMADFETEFPVSEFVGISAEAAVGKLAGAFKSWDEPMLKVILRIYSLKSLEARGFKGCTLTIKGKPFKSGVYCGFFVPCEVVYSDGRKGKVTFALRNDNQWGCWEIDGGL